MKEGGGGEEEEEEEEEEESQLPEPEVSLRQLVHIRIGFQRGRDAMLDNRIFCLLLPLSPSPLPFAGLHVSCFRICAAGVFDDNLIKARKKGCKSFHQVKWRISWRSNINASYEAVLYTRIHIHLNIMIRSVSQINAVDSNS